ncbi:hypothetical protein CCYA_CCYA03G1068 [Cyanidiococcus yangmingshanensis]|nr:hypothetical protein CCYA_CCYA03G1068 [Cyanidiococcus yangmingshanensis]
MNIWRSLSLPSCPDALSCWSSHQETFLVYGAYELCEGKRTGGLGVVSLAPTGPLQATWHSLGTGVLDLDCLSETCLILATADGGVHAYDPEKGALRWTLPRSLASGTLALSVDHAARATQTFIAASYSDGSLAVADIASQEWVWECSHAHTHEAWCPCFGAEEHVLISGGDDGYMRLWDWRLRPESSSCVFACHAHQGIGVTAACVLDAHSFLSGGFDEHLRAWDMRMLSKPLAHLQMPGGVWRIQQNEGAFLVACMHGHAAIIGYDGKELTSIALLGGTMNGSLVYGASWIRDLSDSVVCATASFYDKELYLWRMAANDLH